MGIFSEIPLHNQMDVLKKLNFEDFVKYKQCSKETLEIAKNFKYRLPLIVPMILIEDGIFRFEIGCLNWRGFGHVRDEPVCMHVWNFSCFMKLSSEHFAHLEECCRNVKLIVKNLSLKDEENDSAMTDRLINFLKPYTLQTWKTSSTFLRSLSELHKIKKFTFITGVMEETDFLFLQASEIDLYAKYKRSWLKSSAVNKFLKQWYYGEREIKELIIHDLDYPYDAIYDNLDFSILWAPKSQEASGQLHQIITEAEKNFATLQRKLPFTKISSLTRADGKKIFVGTYRDCGSMTLVAMEYQEIGEVEEWTRKIIKQETPYDVIINWSCK